MVDITDLVTTEIKYKIAENTVKNGTNLVVLIIFGLNCFIDFDLGCYFTPYKQKINNLVLYFFISSRPDVKQLLQLSKQDLSKNQKVVHLKLYEFSYLDILI